MLELYGFGYCFKCMTPFSSELDQGIGSKLIEFKF